MLEPSRRTSGISKGLDSFFCYTSVMVIGYENAAPIRPARVSAAIEPFEKRAMPEASVKGIAKGFSQNLLTLP
jgi:hypothetical protein